MKIKISEIQNVPIKGHDKSKVDFYITILMMNREVEPITVRKATNGYWLCDGAHRIKAHEQLNRTEINVILVPNSIDADCL